MALNVRLNDLLSLDVLKNDLIVSNIQSGEDVHVEGLIHVYRRPFTIVLIENFFDPLQLQSVRAFLNTVEYEDMKNDMFQFRQTADLVSKLHEYEQSKGPFGIYDRLCSKLNTWLKNTFNYCLNEKVRLTSSKYTKGDYLLCHDDLVGGKSNEYRKIAFVCYVGEDDFCEIDGGSLDIFDSDEIGSPKNEVFMSIYPKVNSIALFEVSSKSFHQVREILSDKKMRITIHGWFHGFNRELFSHIPTISNTGTVLSDFEAEHFVDLINPDYLYPEVQYRVHEQLMGSMSDIMLPDFLTDTYYDEMYSVLEQIEWILYGPPNRRRYFVPVHTQSLAYAKLQNFLDFMGSKVMAQLLGAIVHLEGLEVNGFVRNENTSFENSKVKLEVRKITDACYTMITDQDMSEPGSCLWFSMFFTDESNSVPTMGAISFICEDEEKIRIEPIKNSLCIVVPTQQIYQHFTHYVNESSVRGTSEMKNVHYYQIVVNYFSSLE